MSRKGNPYDNAVMESFYRTLKRELVQDFKFENPEQARLEIFKYIETYYNTKRIHSALGYLSPVEFESQNSYLSVHFIVDIPLRESAAGQTESIGDIQGSHY